MYDFGTIADESNYDDAPVPVDSFYAAAATAMTDSHYDTGDGLDDAVTGFGGSIYQAATVNTESHYDTGDGLDDAATIPETVTMAVAPQSPAVLAPLALQGDSDDDFEPFVPKKNVVTTTIMRSGKNNGQSTKSPAVLAPLALQGDNDDDFEPFVPKKNVVTTTIMRPGKNNG